MLADGERVRASADEHPDLFWAIRGGGGNFGVVTSFEFRLHEVGTVIGGPTFWPVETGRRGALGLPRVPAERAARAERLLRLPHACPRRRRSPRSSTCARCAASSGATSAREEDAAAAMAPLLDALPEPLLHGVGADAAPGAAGRVRRRSTRRATSGTGGRTSSTRSPTRRSTLHARFGAEMPTWQSTMHLYPIDGAAHDVAPTDTAWGYRDANWGSVFAGVDPDPANVDAIRSWSVDYYEALHPYSAGGAYVNMMMDEGQERVRASYRGNYERLARVKASYDPENLFRVNQNIQPA